MAFAGIPNAKDRGDIIAYLKEAKWDWSLFKTNVLNEEGPFVQMKDFVLIIDESAKISNLIKVISNFQDINIAL